MVEGAGQAGAGQVVERPFLDEHGVKVASAYADSTRTHPRRAEFAAIDPVADGLLVELQHVGNLGDRQEFVTCRMSK